MDFGPNSENAGHAGHISVANRSLFLGCPIQLFDFQEYFQSMIIFIDTLFLSLTATCQPYCPEEVCPFK